LGLTFIFTSAISLFMTTDPLSACSNHETCALIHNIEPVNKLPAQCVETLYSPVNVKQSSVIRF
ncbi:hypothetical protein KC669_05210, partial [Candidatus Dojkabacteria bacterium]|nr:hypothetical protein [Candidatus Dojkabacteria bacterium]